MDGHLPVREHRQAPRVWVEVAAPECFLSQHVHDAREIRVVSLLTLLLVHRESTLRVESLPQSIELDPRLLPVHEIRADVALNHLRSVVQIPLNHLPQLRWLPALDQVAGLEALPFEARPNLIERVAPHARVRVLLRLPRRVPELRGHELHVSPERQRLTSELSSRPQLEDPFSPRRCPTVTP